MILDSLAMGRIVRTLSVVDAFKRKSMSLEGDNSLGSGSLTRVLGRLILNRKSECGSPENVRSDNRGVEK